MNIQTQFKKIKMKKTIQTKRKRDDNEKCTKRRKYKEEIMFFEEHGEDAHNIIACQKLNELSI